MNSQILSSFLIACSWHALENVALNEGNTLQDSYGKTLQQCKDLCDQNAQCKSLAFNSNGACHIKDKEMGPTDSQKVISGYQTYFKGFTCNWATFVTGCPQF